MRKLKDNLLLQFSLAGFIVMAALAVVLAVFLSNKIQSDAIDALAEEAKGASSGRLLRAITPADLETPMTGERYKEFHEFVQQYIVSDRTARVKLWAKDGTVTYSNNPAGVGEKFPNNASFLKGLRGEKAIEIKLSKDVESVHERHLGTLIEVYTPIIFPGTTEPQGVLEIYQYYLPTAQRINELRRWLFGWIAVGFAVLYGCLVSIVWRGWRTIVRQQDQLESFNVRLEKQVEERTAELREAQEKLIRTERLAAIGELSAGVAHELRNPLGAIKNATYYIKGKVDGSEVVKENPRVREFLGLMDEEVEACNRIITDLMDFARVNPPKVSPTKLDTVLENALSRLEVKKNVKVIKDFAPALPEVVVDSDQMRRAFANLIKNADEAMPEGGTLTISARPADGLGEVKIRDSGHGISEQDLAKIFDPLFTTKPRGIGMGLAIVKQIVERHKGALDVSSQPGKGTTFTVRLPLNREQTAQTNNSANKGTSYDR
ncbi:MAG: hypothetical protein HYT78_06760 [Deltaproteobacteria bacterium]|nr:hypothetical protein [Deltaproteobacteria bacterium]